MKKVTIYIVEDDPIISFGLKLLFETNNLHVIGTSKDAVNALNKIKLLQPNIVIIDVRLANNTSGVWLGQQLNASSLNIPFIYLTAYNNQDTINSIYATNPACYVKKPFDDASLILNIQLALAKINESTAHSIRIKDGNTFKNIKSETIDYIISEGNYLNIYRKNQSVLVIREKLDSIHSKLPPKIFKKIHRRYIVNINSIESFNTKFVIINNNKLNISRTFHKQFLEETNIKFRS